MSKYIKQHRARLSHYRGVGGHSASLRKPFEINSQRQQQRRRGVLLIVITILAPAIAVIAALI
jgi:hypothetical protein